MIDLPGYRMIHELGRGGMARVYLALHEGLHRQVAIKVLYPNFSADSSFTDRFLREARIVASLNHPNIITVFDVGVHRKFHYIAMEYLPGNRLDDKIKAGLGIKEILSIMKHLCLGLKVAHDKGFIHRDIKPANILFREDGTPVITDFGVARAEQSDTEMTEAGTIIGTPNYMSPEQAQGYKLTSNSDIYSLGIIFYEMLNGEVPYAADSSVAVMYKHVNEPIPALAERYSIYQPLLNKLMAKDRNERYQNAADIISDIEDLEMLQAPAEATRVMPVSGRSVPRDGSTRQGINWSLAADWLEAVRNIITPRIIIVAVSVLLVAGMSAFFVSDFQEHRKEFAEQKRQHSYQQLVEQQRLERIRMEEAALEQERLAKERQQKLAEQQGQKQAGEKLQAVAAENTIAEATKGKAVEQERLAMINSLREKKRAEQTSARVAQLIDRAESSLRINRLKDANNFYQQVLRLDADNKQARQGINLVAGRYLRIAERKARQTEFGKADYYFNRAKSISPHHPQLAAIKEKIISLKNKQRLREHNRQQNKAIGSGDNKSAQQPTTSQRIFGGF